MQASAKSAKRGKCVTLGEYFMFVPFGFKARRDLKHDTSFKNCRNASSKPLQTRKLAATLANA